jgi:hypothetical protein
LLSVERTRILARMQFVNPCYPLSELTRDVIAGCYRSYDAFGRYRADLIVERTLIVEVKTGLTLDPQAIPQLLNYLNVTRRVRAIATSLIVPTR